MCKSRFERQASFQVLAGTISSSRASSRAGPIEGLSFASVRQAVVESGKLRYLDGGGMGCMHESEHPNDAGKRYHHYTFQQS